MSYILILNVPLLNKVGAILRSDPAGAEYIVFKKWHHYLLLCKTDILLKKIADGHMCPPVGYCGVPNNGSQRHQGPYSKCVEILPHAANGILPI